MAFILEELLHDESFENLGFTQNDHHLYQKFFRQDSPLHKYFSNKGSYVHAYDIESSDHQHGILHVTTDKIPIANQYISVAGFGPHPGLMSSTDKSRFDEIYSTFTGGSEESVAIGSTLIGDSAEEFLIKIHKRMYIGGSDSDVPQWTNKGLWDTNRVPIDGLFVKGSISTGTSILSPEATISDKLIVGNTLIVAGHEITPTSFLPDAITMSEAGDITANSISTNDFSISGFIKIHDNYIEHIGDVVKDYIEIRVNDTPIKTHNTMVLSNDLSTQTGGGKVFINVPKPENSTYDYLSHTHPANSVLWVGGKTTIGTPGSTTSRLVLHSSGIYSQEHVTFEIMHGFNALFSPNYPSMKIDSTGGLRLQSDADISNTANLQIGSDNKKVGVKIYGQVRIKANLSVSPNPTNAVSEYALAFVAEGTGGGESITGTPIAIRNDSMVGIGTMPGTKTLNVSGGADFKSYDSSFQNIITASVFENPGNETSISLSGDTIIPFNHYDNDGTLLIRGSNQKGESEDGNAPYYYDIHLTGNKLGYFIGDTYHNEFQFWGTRTDGRFHIWDNNGSSKYLEINPNDDNELAEFLIHKKTEFKIKEGSITLGWVSPSTDSNFYTTLGNFISDKGDLWLKNGAIKLKEYDTDKYFGVENNGTVSALAYLLPSYQDDDFPGIGFGIDELANATLSDLNIYGTFAFKKKTSLDLFGGNLDNIHDINGSVDEEDDSKYGNITGFHQIKSLSNQLYDSLNKTSLVSGYYSIIGGSSFIDEELSETLLTGKITGYPYLIGNRTLGGFIKNYKDIIGIFDEIDLGDASNSGDIKYYKNIIGFDFTNIDSVPFTTIVANPNYDAETNPNAPQTITIVNPSYPSYQGGSVINFQNITGITNLYHQGHITNFNSITIQSASFTKTSSYIYSSLIEIGERPDSTNPSQNLLANNRTLLFKGGTLLSQTIHPTSFQFIPSIVANPDYDAITNPTVSETIINSHFSLHNTNNTGNIVNYGNDYSDSSYIDLKVRHIWLDGEELKISASQLNDGFTGGFYSLQGTTPMQADAPFGGFNVIDVNEIQTDYIKNRNDTIDDIKIIPNEGDNSYSKGRVVLGDTNKSNTLMINSFNNDGFFTSNLKNSDGAFIHSDVIDTRSIIIAGTESVATRLSLSYRDYSGNIKEGISINPDGTVTLPDNPLGFSLSGDLGFMPVSVGKVHLGLLNILGLTLDSENVENTFLGTLILTPSLEEGEPTLTFNTKTEGTGTTEDPEFKFISLITTGSLLLQTGSNQKIKLDTNIVELAESSELHFNQKAKIWYDYTKNKFNFGNYIVNPDVEASETYIWKEGISIFYDQLGLHNETYDFNSLRVGIGTDEAYKTEGKKTFSETGDQIEIKYGNLSIPSQFLTGTGSDDFSEYHQDNVIISYGLEGTREDFPEIKKGNILKFDGLNYNVLAIEIISDFYYIVKLSNPPPSAPNSSNVGASTEFIIKEWEHKYTNIATLTVDGLIKADNLLLSQGFSGNALFDQIEVGVDSYIDKGIIKVDNYDSTSTWTDEALIISAGNEPETDRDIVITSKNGDIMFGDYLTKNFEFNNTWKKIIGFNVSNSYTFSLGDNNSSGALSLYNSDGTLDVFLSADSTDNYIADNSFDIRTHDKALDKGLKLASTLVTSSAVELNYLTDVVPGETKSNKAIVVGSTKNIDTLDITTLFINENLLLASSDELNVLVGVDPNTDFSLLDKYLGGLIEGQSVAQKALIPDINNEINELTLTTLNVHNIAKFNESSFGINFLSPISFGNSEFKADINLDGYIALKEVDGTVTVTEDEKDYVFLYAKDEDLWIKYWDHNLFDNPIIKNISENTVTWDRYLSGNNLYYKEGKVGIFASTTTTDKLEAVDKLHLADGNFVLQLPLIDLIGNDIERVNAYSAPPRISLKSTKIDASAMEDLSIGIHYISPDQSVSNSYSKIQASNLSLDIGSKYDLNLQSESGNVNINSSNSLKMTAQGSMSLHPSYGDSHGDLIIYDQTYESTSSSSVGQIAIGHADPKHWLDIRRLSNVFNDGLQSWDAEGMFLVDPFMVNFQNGNNLQIKLLNHNGELFHGITNISSSSLKLIDIKNPDIDNGNGTFTPTASYLTLLANKHLGINDNNPSLTLSARGDAKFWGSEPKIYLGKDNFWTRSVVTSGNGSTVNLFNNKKGQIQFIGGDEIIHHTGASTPPYSPNHVNYAGISAIYFNNTIDNLEERDQYEVDPAPYPELRTPIYNQYIDFRFISIGSDVDGSSNLDQQVIDGNITEGSDTNPSVTATRKDYTIVKDTYKRSMMIDGVSGNVGIGQHFARGLKPIQETTHPAYTLDVQGSFRVIAQLDDSGVNGNVYDGVTSIDPLVETAGDPTANYGYESYNSNMGEIIIERETLETPLSYSITPEGSSITTYYNEQKYYKVESINSDNNLDIPTSYFDGTDGGYQYNYGAVVKISAYNDSFIYNGSNFGLGTTTPDSPLHIVNSEMFLVGDADLKINFTEIGNVLPLTTIESTNALEMKTNGINDLNLVSSNDINLITENDFNITTSNKEMVLTDTKIKFINLDDPTHFQTRGYFSSDYTTTDKLFDKNGITVELPDTSLPVMRFLPKIVRSGDTGGYVTINQEDPDPYGITVAFITRYYGNLAGQTVISSPADNSQDGSTSEQKAHVRTHANATGDLATTAENSVYILLEYESTQTIPPERWQEIYPEVLPVEGEKITLYNPNESFSEEFVIDTITFISNGVATYDGAIYVDKYNVVLTTQIGSNSDLISTDRIDDLKWDHSWDRQKYSQMTVDGFIADASSSGETLVTLDPTKQQQVYIKDKSGNGNHSVLWRNEVDDDITLSTLSFTPLERDAILSNDNNLIRSQLELSTYHYDFEDVNDDGEGENSNKSGLIKRMEFFDSWNAPGDQFPNNEIIGITDLPAEMSIYANTTIGTANTTNIDTHEGSKNLKIYGLLDILRTDVAETSNLSLDDVGNLAIAGNAILGGYATIDSYVTIGTDATIGGYATIGDYATIASHATVGGYLNVTGNLDAGGEVTFNDKLIEINRNLQDSAIETPSYLNIALSGILIHKGESSLPYSFTLDIGTPGTNYLNVGGETYEFEHFSGVGNGSGYSITVTLDGTTVSDLTFSDYGQDFAVGDVWKIIQKDVAGNINSEDARFTVLTTNTNIKPSFVWSEGDSAGVTDILKSNQFVLLNDYVGFSTQIHATQRAYINDDIADLRANSIFLKDIYISNENDGTPNDYAKITASADELNILQGATLSTIELNYVDDVTSSIQSQFQSLDDRKVEMSKYFIDSTVTQLINDPLGLVTLTEKPFYIRTERTAYTPDSPGSDYGVYDEQHKDSFLAITKKGTYTTATDDATQEDFLGGALYYDGELSVTNTLDDTYKAGDFVISGYPYNKQTNLHGDTWVIVDENENQYTQQMYDNGDQQYVNPNYDARTEVFDYSPDILLQPTKYIGSGTGSFPFQPVLQTGGGNVGIGVSKANYKLHVEGLVTAKGTLQETTWDTGTNNPPSITTINDEKDVLGDEYYRPVVAFFGKNSFKHNLAMPVGTTNDPAGVGSVRIRIAPQPDFVIPTPTYSHPRQTNFVELEVNSYEVTGQLDGQQGDFNVRNYYSDSGGSGGNIHFITSEMPVESSGEDIASSTISVSVGGLRTFGQLGVGNTPDLGSILTLYGKVHNSSTESINLNSSIQFINPIFNSDGSVNYNDSKQKFIFLNNSGELEIADSISDIGEVSGSSLKFNPADIAVAKNIVPGLTTTFGTLLSIDINNKQIIVNENLSGSAPIDLAQDGIVPLSVSVVAETDTLLQGNTNTNVDRLRFKIATTPVFGLTSPLVPGMKLFVTNSQINFPSEVEVLESYTDPVVPNRHVIVTDKRAYAPWLPGYNTFRIGWEPIIKVNDKVIYSSNDLNYSNTVKSFEKDYYYNHIDDKLYTRSSIINLKEAPVINHESKSDFVDVHGGGGSFYYNNQTFTSRMTLGRYKHDKFNNTGIPRQFSTVNVEQDIKIEVQITTKWADIYAGDVDSNWNTTYATLNSFWTSIRQGAGIANNIGKYQWRRTWREGIDPEGIKGVSDGNDGFWTVYEIDIPYDIYDDFLQPNKDIDYYNFDFSLYKEDQAINAHGLQKLGKTAGFNVSDLNLFISFLPINVAVNDTFSFILKYNQGLRKPITIQLGTQESELGSVNVQGTGSLHLGTSHLQESKVNPGSFKIASSALEMVKLTDPIDEWDIYIENDTPTEIIDETRKGLISPIDGGSVFVARSTDDENINESLYFLPPRDGVYGNLDETGTFVEGNLLTSNLIKYSEDYTVPIDLSLGSGGSADLSDITTHLIPAQTNNYNIGSEAFDPDTEDPNNPLEIRAFKDVFIHGNYKYWNATTSQFDDLNSASIPYHEALIGITPKASNYTIDESYFTVLNEAFDNVNHIEFVRVRFDYNPFTGNISSTTLDTDNIQDTTKRVTSIEDFGFRDDFKIIEKISGVTSTETLEILYSNPKFDPSMNTWQGTDFDSSVIDETYFNYTTGNPEEITLWSNIKVPYDFANWDSSNPLSIKLRALDKANVKVIITAYDTDKVKTHEVVKDYDSLTDDWVTYYLSDVISGTWFQSSEMTFKIFIELADPESAIDISFVNLKYDTRYEYTTLLPIVNFTSTTTSISQTNGLTTLNEPLMVEKNSYGYTDGLNGTTSEVAIVAQGHIIPDIPSDSNNSSIGWDIGSLEYPFRHAYFSDDTIYLGGQKSVAWGVIGESNDIGYNKGAVGIGNVNPTESLEVTGNAKIVGNVNATTFTEASGTSTQWNTAYTHSLIAGGNSVHVSTTENTQWDSAYTHSLLTTGNPHSISITDLTDTAIASIGVGEVLIWQDSNGGEWVNKLYSEADIATATSLTAHLDDTGDPHEVTPTQIGLGNVDNVSLLTWAGAIDRDLIPDDLTRSLGTALKPWKDLHISDATLFVGGEVQTGWKADTVTRSESDFTDIKFTKGFVGVGIAVPTTEFEVSGVSTLGGDVNITGTGNLVVAGTLTGSGYNDTQWNTAYTHSLIAGGDSVHVSTDENTQWDSAYTHSQIVGGNSVHVSTDENTQWDSAYTHSLIAGGNSVHVSTDENTQWDTAYTHSQVSGGIHNTGTVTSIIAGGGLAGGTITTTGTISHADTSSQASLTALTGANVVSDIDLDIYGHITSLATRTMTLANLGYTGANNANYITNNNQLTNGAGYELANQKGVASGYASLDSNSKIPTSQMPNLALTDVNVVATQVLQLALTVQEGDVAIRSDLAKSYIALNSDNANMADWAELLSPASPVQSVNSQTGNIVLTTSDIGEGSNLYYTNARVETKVVDLLKEGTGITLTHDAGSNELTIAGSALYTNENAQDTIADFLVGGTGITLVEDDNANTLTINGSALYTDEDAMDAVAGMIQNGTGITWNYVDASNTLTATVAPVAGTITGDLNVVGDFSATTKSFDIEHPTKEGKRLIHGSLEGAEHGVYVRGKLKDENEIKLPDYWIGLVDEDSITVQLTAIGQKQDLWVKGLVNNSIFIGSSTNQVECYYFIQAERKDVNKLIVEV